MHMNIDIWLSDAQLEPNATDSGITVVPLTTDVGSKATLYLGLSVAEMRETRDRLIAAIDATIRKREGHG